MGKDNIVTAQAGTACREKAAYMPMSEERKLEVVAQFTDDVLTQLGKAFIEVVKIEGWGKRDLARITGLNETGVNHVLSGRRRNLTAETIAILSRAMQKRPHLQLVDVRPANNNVRFAESLADQREPQSSAASALQETQAQRTKAGQLGASFLSR
jgi:plasmid maintenance system antidote protein VapI